MRLKSLFLILPLVAFASAAGAQTVRIGFEAPGPREVFVAPAVPDAPFERAIKTEAKSVELSANDATPAGLVIVWDRRSGNVASRPIGKIAGPWLVKPEDYRLVGAVTLRVEHRGRPVAAGSITVSDGKRTITRILDPAARGELRLFGLAPGNLGVKVRYRAQAGADGTLEQIFPLGLKRAKADPVLVVSIPEAVATLGEEPAAGAGESGGDTRNPANEAGRSSPIGSILVFAVAAAAVSAAAFFVLKLFRDNPKVVEEKLAKLGVDIPKPADSEPDAPLPSMRAPDPAPQIILDDAAPEPVGPAAASAAMAPAQPKLVGEAGTIFFLPEGESTVGRDEGLEMSVVGESTVSRRHAQFVRSGDLIVVKDLGSTNGTYVNGVRVQGEASLRPGDTVLFGSARFRLET